MTMLELLEMMEDDAEKEKTSNYKKLPTRNGDHCPCYPLYVYLFLTIASSLAHSLHDTYLILRMCPRARGISQLKYRIAFEIIPQTDPTERTYHVFIFSMHYLKRAPSAMLHSRDRHNRKFSLKNLNDIHWSPCSCPPTTIPYPLHTASLPVSSHSWGCYFTFSDMIKNHVVCCTMIQWM